MKLAKRSHRFQYKLARILKRSRDLIKLFCAEPFKVDVSQAESFLVAPDVARDSDETDFEPLAALAPIDGQRLAIVLT